MKSLKSPQRIVRAFLIATLAFSLSSITTQSANAQCSVNHIPKSICGFDDVIDRFTFNGVTANNVSCNGINGYSNHAASYGFKAVPGSTVSVTASLGAAYNNQGLAIWIDFNNDQFYDASEYVFSAGPDTIVTGMINIPFNAISTSVHMRLMSMPGNVPAPADACLHPLGYGETEDYLLEILAVNPNNAAILSIDSPAYFCAGPKDIYARVANLGINVIDSVEIHWEFNGVQQTPIDYKVVLDTFNGSAPNSNLVYLGNRNFSYGNSNSIKVWTSMPNGMPDPFAYDDTLTSIKKPGITGSLTIDQSLPVSSNNYADFSSLAYDMNNYGICGPVSVTVAPGFYNDYFHLNKISGSSAINTITIDGVDSSLVSLSHDGSIAKSTISLLQTDFVTIENMSVEYLGANGGSVIKTDQSSHITVANNHLQMDTTAGSFELENIRIEAFPSSHLTIIKNRITGGAIGINLIAQGNGINASNKIIQNEILQVFEKGMMSTNQDSLIISGNYIDLSSRGVTSSYGLQMVNNYNSIVEANYIRAINTGAYLDNYNNSSLSDRRIQFFNNMIIADGSGLEITGIDSMNIYHNSVSVGSAGPSLSIINWDSVPKIYDIRNNIFSATTGYSVRTNEPMTAFSAMDYNAYHTTGPNLFEINSSAYIDLAALQSAFPSFNSSSVQGNPQFVSANSDLHIIGSLVNDAGDSTLGITVDIDGDVRPMSLFNRVDIGADEFNPPSCPKPHSLFANDPKINSISIGWIGNSISFQYIIVPSGNAMASGNISGSQNDTVLVTGLNPASSYDFYVREVCARGDSSQWAGPLTFRTAEILDYAEDFETASTGALAQNWKSISFPSNPGLEWSVDTLSQYSSVSHDHTIGAGGKFTYFKTNFGPGEAVLESPAIFIDSSISSFTLSFWYYMHGADMGSLSFYIDTNLISTISGQQQTSPSNPWLFFDTLITGYSNQYINLVFRANKGFGVLSEMAIDDVRLDSILVVNVDEAPSVDRQVRVYPNPSKGSLKFFAEGINGRLEVEINDIKGKLIYQKEFFVSDQLDLNIDIGGSPEGVYVANIKFNNTVQTEKLVIIK